MKHLLLVLLINIFSLISWAQVGIGEYDETNPLSIKPRLSTLEWNPGQSGTLELDLELPAGYRAYEDQFQLVIFEPDGFKMGKLEISPLHQWDDKYLKKRKSGIIEKGKMRVLIEAPIRFDRHFNQLKFELTYQACNDQFCLFPTSKMVSTDIRLVGAPAPTANLQTATQNSPPSNDSPSLLNVNSFEDWLRLGWLPSLLFVFIAGILTSFTPCIFPMIPITLAVLGHHAEKRTRMQNLIHSFSYVLGIATTYSLLGVIAALSGGIFGASLGNPWVLGGICLLLLAMALSMYGVFEIQVPAFVRQFIGKKKSNASLGGAYLTGLFAGIVASPCVGPVLVGILTYVSVSKDIFLGFSLLFVYALGLGLIFLLLGAYSELAKKLPRSGPWMELFKFSLGSFMLAAFYYYFDLLVEDRWFDVALGAGLVTLGSAYGAFSRPQSVLNQIRKGMMQATLFIGMAYLAMGILNLRPYIATQITGQSSINKTSNIQWMAYSAEAFTQALEIQKPIVIDFWADWCAACHELEEKTFTDSIVQSMASNFTFIKFDATKDSEQLKELKQKYNIKGLPTLLFFNNKGQLISELTLTQFEEPREFTRRLETLLKK